MEKIHHSRMRIRIRRCIRIGIPTYCWRIKLQHGEIYKLIIRSALFIWPNFSRKRLV